MSEGFGLRGRSREPEAAPASTWDQRQERRAAEARMAKNARRIAEADRPWPINDSAETPFGTIDGGQWFARVVASLIAAGILIALVTFLAFVALEPDPDLVFGLSVFYPFEIAYQPEGVVRLLWPAYGVMFLWHAYLAYQFGRRLNGAGYAFTTGVSAYALALLGCAVFPEINLPLANPAVFLAILVWGFLVPSYTRRSAEDWPDLPVKP